MANISFFSEIKSKLGSLARSPQGLYLMTAICFIEPIFLPMIPELVVGPMLLARRNERLKVIVMALIGTLLGSLVTYAIGYFLGKILVSWLAFFSLEKIYYMGLTYLEKYGIFLPFIMSVTPLPLKMVTWSCGIARFNILIYALGILSGRLLRYSWMLLISGEKKHTPTQSPSASDLLSNSAPKGI